MLNEKILDFCSLRKLPNFQKAALVLLLIITALPFINLLAELNSRLILPHFMAGIETWMKQSEASAAKITEAFLNVSGKRNLLYNIVLMALIPAIGEELLFRGLLLRQFNFWLKNMHWAIIVTAILFSALHMQFYGFIPRMLLGVLFGYLVWWSGSLWTSMLAHFINNLMAVIFYYLYSKQLIGKSVDTFGATSATYIWAALSAVVVTVIIYLIYKQRISLSKE